MKTATAKYARFACTDAVNSARADELERFAGVARFAGFDGVEIGAGLGMEPDGSIAAAALRGSGTTLSSVVFRARWRGSEETERERAEADRWISFAGRFPGARLVLEQIDGADEWHVGEKLVSLVGCVSAIAHRAQDAGVAVTLCPESVQGGVALQGPTSYEDIFDGFGEAPVGFTPDLDRIGRGGLDPLEVIHTLRDRVDHVRLGQFAGVGSDALDERATERARVVAFLAHTGFDGWFVVDVRPSSSAETAEAGIRSAGMYVAEQLVPLVEEAHKARTQQAD